MDERPKVVPASFDDRERLADVLARAFQDDPVSGWVFPDPQDRARRHRGFTGVFLDHALANGQVDTTPERNGVALWISVGPGDSEPEGLEEALRSALGPAWHNFSLLGEQMDANHPHDRRHWYLQFIAVDPEFQARGVGTALIRHRLAEFDAAEIPAYLESSSPRNFSLYEQLGFRKIGRAIRLPDGAVMQPMWREPHVNGNTTN